MAHDPDANAPPAPSPASQEPAGSSEESVVRAPTSHRGDDSASDEEHVREVDPHPDTPDDFDEDASSPRESIEAVNDAGGDSDDD